jgi:ribosomal-protein-alanine N-acetyltransferase
MNAKSTPASVIHALELWEIRRPEDLAPGLDLPSLAEFLHENMRPYEDTLPDIRRALDYALSAGGSPGGFILAALREHDPVGAIVILNTGMGGYVPEHLLLFVGVRPVDRGQGIGAWLIREALQRCRGQVKLHVEYDNPAKRLYERLGFTTKYAEMRTSPGERP